jgi:peptidoglycan hydrolase FlgJ
MTISSANPTVYTDLQGIAELRRNVQTNDPAALREAARQFESLFTRMMLKSMREASFGDPLLGGDSHNFYQGMFDDQLAVEMSRGRGLGLADLLVQQLARAGLEKAPLENTQPEKITSRKQFIEQLSPAADAAGRELGVDPRHILAQAALETGWGRSVPVTASGESSFNYFGIKVNSQWQGQSVTVATVEYENGVPITKQEKFKAYSNPEEAFSDYVALLRDNPRYANALQTGADSQSFAKGLIQGGYATDPAYAQKVSAIAQKLNNQYPTLKFAAHPPLTAALDSL